ncbi:MAG: replicative DNA helicase [Oscillospiraceae bacterium]|nr:replicative DNA helicase [Oscillospiraceae bacterium]
MDELLSRSVPQSNDAEQAVLGSMLIDPKCIPQVMDRLKVDHFYHQPNRELYEVMLSMFNYSMVIDPLTVIDQMKQQGVYHEDTTRRYIMGLLDITPSAANVLEYASIVRDKALLRSLGETAGEIGDMVSSQQGSAEEILEASEKKIYAIRSGRSVGGLEPISQILHGVYGRLQELAKLGSDISGVSTGIRSLDTRLSGLNNSDLIILAARPGVGKTSLALNLTLNVAKGTGKAVAFFSLEMSKEQLGMRLLASEAFVDSSKLRTGQLNRDEWNSIIAAATSISRTNIMVDDTPGVTVAEMNARCRRVENLGLVVIDYIQLMSGDGRSDSRVQVVSELSRSMKIMAKELNVPVICLSQLSRDSEKASRKPKLSDLRESGSIEQDADVVMFLYREATEDDSAAMSNEVDCIVAKNRHGEPGTVTLQWMPQYTSFSDREWNRDDYDE